MDRLQELSDLKRRRKLVAQEMLRVANGKFTPSAAARFETLDQTQEQLRKQIEQIEPDSIKDTQRRRARIQELPPERLGI